MSTALMKRPCVALVKAPRRLRQLRRIPVTWVFHSPEPLSLPDPSDFELQLDERIDALVRIFEWQLPAEWDVS